MSRFVVDASVAAKWMLTEEHTEQALALRDQELLAPELLAIEMANVLRTAARSGGISEETARNAVRSLPPSRVKLHDSGPLLFRALDIALAHSRSVYDALYLALALREDCQLVTADRRLYSAMWTEYPQALLWIGDIPAAQRDTDQ